MIPAVETLVSILIVAVAAALVLYRLRESLEGLGDVFEGILDFAVSGIAGMAAAGAVLLLLLWLGYETFFLAGPRVYDAQMMVGKPFPFTVESPGRDWVFTVGPTGKRRKAIGYRILGPGGEVAFTGSDSFRKSVRRFSFTPALPGEYVLQVDYLLPGNYTRLAWLRINRDDRARLLRRFGHLWPVKLGVWSPFYPREQLPGHEVDWQEIRQGLSS